jgi:hypothetical protein
MVRTKKPQTPPKGNLSTATDQEQEVPETSTPATGKKKRGRIKSWWGSLSGAWHFVIAVAVAVSTIYGACAVIMKFLDPSHTRFVVNNSDPKFIHLKVWNTGHNWSTLVGYRVRFPGELMVESTELSLATPDTIIEPQDAAHLVDLTVGKLTRSCNPATKRRYLKTEIETVLRERSRALIVTVEVDVQESGHFPEFRRNEYVATRNATPTAVLLAAFILGRIPDVDDEDIPCQP